MVMVSQDTGLSGITALHRLWFSGFLPSNTRSEVPMLAIRCLVSRPALFRNESRRRYRIRCKLTR